MSFSKPFNAKQFIEKNDSTQLVVKKLSVIRYFYQMKIRLRHSFLIFQLFQLGGINQKAEISLYLVTIVFQPIED